MSIDNAVGEPQNRLKLTQLLAELGARYANQGLALFEMYQGSDVHAYYRLVNDPTEVIHIKGEISASTSQIAVIHVRLMDNYRMKRLREQGTPIGGEDVAVSHNFGNMRVEYNQWALQALLSGVPQLRKFFLPPLP